MFSEKGGKHIRAVTKNVGRLQLQLQPLHTNHTSGNNVSRKGPTTDVALETPQLSVTVKNRTNQARVSKTRAEIWIVEANFLRVRITQVVFEGTEPSVNLKHCGREWGAHFRFRVKRRADDDNIERGFSLTTMWKRHLTLLVLR